jgi:hypothetical protein
MPRRSTTRLSARFGEALIPLIEFAEVYARRIQEEVLEAMGVPRREVERPGSWERVLPTPEAEVPLRLQALPGRTAPRLRFVLAPQPTVRERLETQAPGSSGLELYVGTPGDGLSHRLDRRVRLLESRRVSLLRLGMRDHPRVDEAVLTAALGQDPDLLVLNVPGSLELVRCAVREADAGRAVMLMVSGRSLRDGVEHILRAGARPGQVARILSRVHGARSLRRLCQRCRIPDDTEIPRLEAAGRELDLMPAPWPGPAPARPHRRGPGCRRCQAHGYASQHILELEVTIDEALRAALAAGRWGALEAAARLPGIREVHQLAWRGDIEVVEALGGEVAS